MPATRSQKQQQLKVDQETNGASTLDTKSSKRKEAPEEADKSKENGQGAAKKGDSGGKGGEEARKEHRDGGEPPAKAQKVEDNGDAFKEKQEPDQGDKKEAASDAQQEQKPQEKVLDGKDVGTVGSNGDEVKWNVVERGQ